MARTFARRATKKLETRAHANRVFKKVTRQWSLSLNIKCQLVEAAQGDDCPNGGKIILMTQAEMQGASGAALGSNIPDAVRIKRIEGNLYFRPTFIPPDGTGTQACYVNVFNNQRTTYMRIGLRKLPTGQVQSGIPDAINPLNNGATPFELSDYADGRWMWLREHHWEPGIKLGGTAANGFNCCSEQAGYVVPPTVTGSNAGWVVPPIVCIPCGDVEDPALNLGCNFEVDAPKWWRVPIRYGRTIVMKESDDLSLYFGWERMREITDAARFTQSPMQFFGGVRLLLES